MPSQRGVEDTGVTLDTRQKRNLIMELDCIFYLFGLFATCANKKKSGRRTKKSGRAGTGRAGPGRASNQKGPGQAVRTAHQSKHGTLVPASGTHRPHHPTPNSSAESTLTPPHPSPQKAPLTFTQKLFVESGGTLAAWVVVMNYVRPPP